MKPTILFSLLLTVCIFALILAYSNIEKMERLQNQVFLEKQEIVDYFNNYNLNFQLEIAKWKYKAKNGTIITYEIIYNCDDNLEMMRFE